MSDRGMGRCRFCSESPSNLDHDGLVLGIRHVVICGAWAHYMLEHNVTLAPSCREKVLAIKPGTFSGKTIAYRSVRGVEDTGTLRIFFVEEDDGIHTRGQAVDAELFNHVRLLVLKCQATDVPPALPESGITTAGGAAPSDPYETLLAQLNQPPAQTKTDQWKVWAVAACHQLHDRLRSTDLSDLATNAYRRSIFHQLIQVAFSKAGFNLIRVIGVASAPVSTDEILAEETIGLYPYGTVNLYVSTDGESVRIWYDRVSPAGNLRQPDGMR